MNASLFDEEPANATTLQDAALRVPELVGAPALVATARPIRDAFLTSLKHLVSQIPDAASDPGSPFLALALEIDALRTTIRSTTSATWWTLVPQRHGADVRRYLRCRGKCSRALDLLEATPLNPPSPRT